MGHAPELRAKVGHLWVTDPGCRSGWPVSWVSLVLIEERASLAAAVALHEGWNHQNYLEE
jgi:hypothetical protein